MYIFCRSILLKWERNRLKWKGSVLVWFCFFVLSLLTCRRPGLLTLGSQEEKLDTKTCRNLSQLKTFLDPKTDVVYVYI